MSVPIRGQLMPLGRQPDGDSMRFRADRPELFLECKGGRPIRPDGTGAVQLRLEGVDAPEAHYAGQSQPLAGRARAGLLHAVGFRRARVVGSVVAACEPSALPASILASVGCPYGRPICYLYPGRLLPELADGANVEVPAALARQSVNHAQLERGMAYPLFYVTMPKAHIKAFRTAAVQAQKYRRGVWFHDRTRDFWLDQRADLGAGGQLILPKLFRRATGFLNSTGGSRHGLTLRQWMEESGAENDWVRVGAGQMRFAELVFERASRIGMAVPAWDLVFGVR